MTKPHAMKRIQVDLSVISTTNEKMVYDCLNSILNGNLSSEYDLNIYVTCNNPASDLPQVLERDYPMVRIIKNATKKGFAANHNVVIRNSRADYLFIINDDIIVPEGAIRKIIRFMEQPENRSVGVLCPRLLYPDGSVQHCTFSFPTPIRSFLSASGIRFLIPFHQWAFDLARFLRWDQGKSRFWNHDETREVETFIGAFMVVRNQVVADVGPMQEVSLGGGEDIEWHYRIWKAGWKIVFFPEVEIFHLHSQTTSTDSRYWIENLKGISAFFRKHRPRWEFFLFLLLTLSAQAVKWGYAALFLNPGKRDFLKSEMRAMVNAWKGIYTG